MDPDISKFISEIWQYKPILIVLLIAMGVIFLLSVIDTHRHRKKTKKHRHRTKHH